MIRKAIENDLEQILEIYAYARKFMIQTGNPNQWINNYPSKDVLVEDLNKEHLYVCFDENKIYGVFVFFIGIDETYNYIEGTWLNNEEYGVIHRIAGSGAKKGMFSEVFNYVTNQICNIRIDTHHDNIVMQKVLNKHGFNKCGIIYLKNGSPRIAYHYKKGHCNE